MAKDFSYEIKKEFGKLGENSKKELNIVSWNEKEPKIDIREWYEQDGVKKCGKGVSLTNDEAKELVNLLSEYLNDDDDDF